MERLKGSIFISAKDIQIISECSITTARREHRAIRDALGIKHPRLTVKQFCEYWKINYDMVVFQINNFR